MPFTFRCPFSRSLGISLLLVAWSVPGWGQTLTRGSVRDLSGRPVPQAEILIDSDGGRFQMADSGSFAILVLETGPITVWARAIGYYPDRRRLLLAGGDTVTILFRLERTAQQLDSVAVVASESGVGRMQPFEERRRAGIGRFYTREVLSDREHSTLGDVLRMTAGIRLVRRPPDCGSGFAIATRGVITAQPWMSCSTRIPFPVACYMAVYLDGIRIWVPGDIEPVNIDQFRVNSLEGIEVYRGPAETPMQYQGTGNACGALLLWTRTGDNPPPD